MHCCSTISIIAKEKAMLAHPRAPGPQRFVSHYRKSIRFQKGARFRGGQTRILRGCPQKSHNRHYAICTKAAVFVDKDVREAAPDGEGKCTSWRNKKA